MTTPLQARLDQVLPTITDPAFLSSKGIGNEIACYIFEYPAQDELEVRRQIAWMTKRLETHHTGIRYLHLDLLDVVLEYLTERKLLDKALAKQKSDGDKALLKSLKGLISGEKIADFIAKAHRPNGYDMVLVSGVGSAWPMLRAHSLLNCLHTVLERTPLVMFYPGTFDGTTLRLFGQIAPMASKTGAKPYYRAFQLVPKGTQP